MSFTSILKYGILSQFSGVSFPISGLTNYWRFDETSGTVVYDALGTQNGTNNGCTIVTGKNNNGLYKDSTGEYVEIASNGYGIFNHQDFTINMWVNPDSIGSVSRVLWSYDYVNHSAPYYAQHIRLASNNKVYFGTNFNGTFDSVYPDDGIPANTWTMITAIKENGIAKLYFNSELQLVNDSYSGSTTSYYNQEVWIGRGNSTSFYYGNQTYDEYGFWNRALTTTELETIYNSGAGLFY